MFSNLDNLPPKEKTPQLLLQMLIAQLLVARRVGNLASSEGVCYFTSQQPVRAERAVGGCAMANTPLFLSVSGKASC